MALLSKGRLSKFMLQYLLQLSTGTTHLKENVILRLGTLAAFSTTKDLAAAWSETKKKAAKQYPDKFILDDRNRLHWNDGTIKILDKKITAANFRKLNELADAEGVNVNKMVSRHFPFYLHRDNLSRLIH